MYREIRSITFDLAGKSIPVPSNFIENIYVYSGAIGVQATLVSVNPANNTAYVTFTPVNNRAYDIAIIYRK